MTDGYFEESRILGRMKEIIVHLEAKDPKKAYGYQNTNEWCSEGVVESDTVREQMSER